ncbi:MAG TPA: hypothetical protein VNO81_08105 [Candidatus Nitrosotenuis sp.]|jgi:hypothetical protein|nr:hypothetical protein [Candidatus Nitrosotenuis sp.]
MQLSDERIKIEILELTRDLALLYKTKYPGLLNAFQALPEDKMIELMIELCDIFDNYKELTGTIARLYLEHRRSTGSLEDRDWPEN